MSVRVSTNFMVFPKSLIGTLIGLNEDVIHDVQVCKP